MFVLAAFNKMAPSTATKSELKPSGKTACPIECNLIYFQSTAFIDSILCEPWEIDTYSMKTYVLLHFEHKK